MRDDTVTLSRRLLAGVVVAALVVGAAAKTFLFRDRTGTDRDARATAADVAVGPEGVDEFGVPFGFAHSREGALAAAVSFLGLGQRVLDAPAERAEETLRAVAADGGEDAFAEAQLASFQGLRDALRRGEGPARLRAGVVATRVEGYTPERARIALWRVLVLSRQGMTTPGAQWGTVTYELVWEGGDWRVWSEDVTAGPSPAASDTRPDDPAALEGALHGFEPYPKAG